MRRFRLVLVFGLAGALVGHPGRRRVTYVDSPNYGGTTGAPPPAVWALPGDFCGSGGEPVGTTVPMYVAVKNATPFPRMCPAYAAPVGPNQALVTTQGQGQRCDRPGGFVGLWCLGWRARWWVWSRTACRR